MERLIWRLLRWWRLFLLSDEHTAVSLFRFFCQRTAASRLQISYLQCMFGMGVPDGRNGLPLLSWGVLPLVASLGLTGFALGLSRHVVLKIHDFGVSLALWTHLTVLAK